MDKINEAIKRSFTSQRQNAALLILGCLLFGVGLWLMVIYLNYYQERFYPKTYIDDLNVAGLTQEAALLKIREKLQQPFDTHEQNLQLIHDEQSLSAPLSQLGIADNLELVVGQAFGERQNQHWSTKLRQIVKQNFVAKRYYVGLTYETEAIKKFINDFKEIIDLPGEKPAALISGAIVTVSPGQTATQLQSEETWQKLHQQLLNRRLRELGEGDFRLEVVIDNPFTALTENEVANSTLRAEKFLKRQLSFTYDYRKLNLSGADLLTLLNWPEGIDDEALENLLLKWQGQVNRPSRDAVFVYDPQSLVVSEFTPEQAGLELDAAKTKTIISDFISQVEASEEEVNLTNSFELPLQSASTQVTLADTNDLGINEVIGFGESWYAHSIPNRAYNVDLSTSRITNHIVRPGAEFSFNKALGEVSAATGYRDAYIIEGGLTKLSAGGGVCQVSTTLFRTLLDAGVKISKRLPHAYRVSYYEIGNEPGFDATVYSGEVDLRFINDTPGHLLISCSSDINNLYMSCKLYGTDDGRSTEIIGYKKWDQRGPLATVYIDDPSLVPGQLKQIDWSASGIKTEFTNVVRNAAGEVLREDRYYSNYRSWAAKYLRGI
jgi:vancomycin resistance protein YoaR